MERHGGVLVYIILLLVAGGSPWRVESTPGDSETNGKSKEEHGISNETYLFPKNVVLREGQSFTLECHRRWDMDKHFEILVSMVTSDGRDCRKGHTPSSICVKERKPVASTNIMTIGEFHFNNVTSALTGSYTCVTNYLSMQTNTTTNIYVIKVAKAKPVILENNKEPSEIPCIYGPSDDDLYVGWKVSPSVEFNISEGKLNILDAGTVVNGDISCGIFSNYYPNMSTALDAGATFTTDIPVLAVTVPNELSIGQNVSVNVEGTAYATEAYYDSTQIRWSWSNDNWASNKTTLCESVFTCQWTVPVGITDVSMEVVVGNTSWTKSLKVEPEIQPQDGTNTTAIIGGVLGGLAGLAAILAVAVVLWCKTCRNVPQNRTDGVTEDANMTSQPMLPKTASTNGDTIQC